MAVVYMHTNKTTGKSYIGVTKHTMEHRWCGHYWNVNQRNTHFSNAIKKYGKDDWVHTVLYEGTIDDCYTQEQILIEKHDTLNNGYNSMEGGVNPPVYRAYGKNNSQFKGYYITPVGKFETLKDAAKIIGCDWQKIKKRCVTDNLRVLSMQAVRCSPDLSDSDAGKTYNQLGWGFENASNTSS